ncbi:MAG: helix-turn-helix domain-containing protein [Bacillota bacterium]|jgi:hypothetical protein
MFNKKKFIAAAVLSGKNMANIADMLGISRVTLYRKLNGDSDFFRKEIEVCCKYLQIENPSEIFLPKKFLKRKQCAISYYHNLANNARG